MEKNSEVFSITEKKISPIEWNREEIFKFFIVSLFMAHPVRKTSIGCVSLALPSKALITLLEL